MKIKFYVSAMVLVLTLILCACSVIGKSDISIEDTQTDNLQQSLDSGEQHEVRFSQGGILGDNFESGYLVYTLPNKENEDYRLYFFNKNNDGIDYNLEEDGYIPPNEIDYKLEKADYVFPDVRENNVSIGNFISIYFIDTGRLLPLRGNDDTVFLAIATYEKDGNRYYDTRVYEFNENEIGVRVNYDLTLKFNEKYYDAEDVPIVDIITLPQNEYIYEIH